MTKLANLSPHRLKSDHRIYCIGDVHGYCDILKQMHIKIHMDIKENPIEKITIIHLGDYINRGPQSREVIEYLMRLSQQNTQIEYIHLYGNHENAIIEFIDDPTGQGREWYAWPNEKYLDSYGVDATEKDAVQLAKIIKETVPPSHFNFIRQLPHYFQIDDFLFVHNGPRPGIKLEEQTKEDLINNREPFMSMCDPHEYFVIHGHTSTSDYQVDIKPNRINLDTGLFYPNGQLTCGILEGSEMRFIQLPNPL